MDLNILPWLLLDTVVCSRNLAWPPAQDYQRAAEHPAVHSAGVLARLPDQRTFLGESASVPGMKLCLCQGCGLPHALAAPLGALPTRTTRFRHFGLPRTSEGKRLARAALFWSEKKGLQKVTPLQSQKYDNNNWVGGQSGEPPIQGDT